MKKRFSSLLTNGITLSLLLIVTSCIQEETLEENEVIKLQDNQTLSQDPNKWGYENINRFDLPNAKIPTTESAVSWSYSGATGPEFWGDLSPEFIACAEGTNQTPIDVPNNLYKVEGSGIDFNYLPSALRIYNNSHTVEFSPAGNNHIKNNGERYDLKQFHVHSSSEHTIDGMSFPLELHFVHQNSISGELLVVGLMVKSGIENENYDSFWTNLPSEDFASLDIANPVNLMALLPSEDDRSLYRYMGSLTTPPCSEGVKWNIFTHEIEMSASQIATFTSIYDHNYRPLQSLNGRSVIELEVED